MSKFCSITGKRPLVGNSVSKSNVKTKRRQLPNLQMKKIFVPELNKLITIKLSVKAMKIGTRPLGIALMMVVNLYSKLRMVDSLLQGGHIPFPMVSLILG